MKNVLYTGNFSIGWNYFNGLQRWQIYSLYNLQRYCERHKIELRVIDNSHTGMSSFHSWLMQKSNWGADNWSIGTMTAIFAQEDFLKSDFDNFAWIDLDVLIINTSMNMFDFVQKEKVSVAYSKNPDCDLDHLFRKKRFLLDFLRIRPDVHCSTGFYLMDRALAQEASSYRTQLGLNPFNDRWNDIIEYFSKGPYFLTEETIMDALLNAGLPKTQLPPELHVEMMSEIIIREPLPFAYHLISGNKPRLPDVINLAQAKFI